MADEKKTPQATETPETAAVATGSPASETATAKKPTAKKPAAKKATTKTDSTAGETKSTATAKTAAASLESVGKKILAAHPRQAEVYVISNGRAFFNQADATNAARGLENKTVTTVKR